MTDKKILDLQNLLDRKSKQDKMGLSSIKIDSLEQSLQILKIKTRKICEIMDKYDIEKEQATSSFDMMSELIYKCTPILQDNELMKILEVPTPYEVVGELLTLNEMTKITEHIMDIHGISDKSENPVAEEIKN